MTRSGRAFRGVKTVRDVRQDVLVLDSLTSPNPVYGTDFLLLSIDFGVITLLPGKWIIVVINGNLYAKQTRKKIFQKKNEKSESRHRLLKFSGKSIPLELFWPSQEKTQYLRYLELIRNFPFFFLSLTLSLFFLSVSSFLPLPFFLPPFSLFPLLPPSSLPSFFPSLPCSLTHSLTSYIYSNHSI